MGEQASSVHVEQRRYRGKKRPREVSTKSLLEALECPVCHETILPPIIQCFEGHLICSGCVDNLSESECPQCCGPLARNPYAAVRNRALERIVGPLAIPCRYQGRGCETTPAYDCAEKHAAACNYRDMKCPECDWWGCFRELPGHFESKHCLLGESKPIVLPCRSTLPIAHSLGKGYATSRIFIVDGYAFVLRLFEHSTGPFAAYMMFAGPEPDRLGYRYRLTVRMKHSYSSFGGVPLHAHQNMHGSALHAEALGLVLSEPGLKAYMDSRGEDSILRIEVFLGKTCTDVASWTRDYNSMLRDSIVKVLQDEAEGNPGGVKLATVCYKLAPADPGIISNILEELVQDGEAYITYDDHTFLLI